MATRSRYRWDRDLQQVVEVPLDYVAPGRPDGAPMVVRDLSPYRSALTGEVIGGRRQHRDHLRAHSCIEVGNERVGTPATRDYWPVGVAEDIRRAMGD